MRLIKLKPVTRCDNGCCTHLATYAVVRKDTPVSHSLRLCRECLTALTELGAIALGQKQNNEVTATESTVDGSRKEKNNVDANMGNRT